MASLPMLEVGYVPTQQEVRATVREFLRTYSREEGAEVLELVLPSGKTATVTRQDLSDAIDHLRFRMRRIVRACAENRVRRQDMCDVLYISMKTLERDEVAGINAIVEALEALAAREVPERQRLHES